MPGTSLGSYAFIWVDEADRTTAFFISSSCYKLPVCTPLNNAQSDNKRRNSI